MNSQQTLPDITSTSFSSHPNALQWVGMEDISLPLQFKVSEKHIAHVVAHADSYVNLAVDDAKGIHMSRLYLLLNQFSNQSFEQASVEKLLNDMVESQGGLSTSAKLSFQFELALNKPSLSGLHSGYQTYPISITAIKNEETIVCELDLTISYSSTCPCSASLSRKLLSAELEKQFQGESVNKSELTQWIESEEGSVATPHSQRSYAYLKLTMAPNQWPDIEKLIYDLEETLATPVQTAVKRSDEQEFARLNAKNLMFCEDAARRLKLYLNSQSHIAYYQMKVEHQESLHPHNAVVVDQKFSSFSLS